MPKTSAVIASPIGKLAIEADNQYLYQIHFESELELLPSQNSLTARVLTQLDAYFTDAKFQFDLPIRLETTAFRQKVLTALQAIPSGSTLTYGELAKKLATGPRAIGNACRHNPIPLVIPCHRIVAQSSIGGFSGAKHGKLIAMKQWLLQHEDKFSNGIISTANS